MRIRTRRLKTKLREALPHQKAALKWAKNRSHIGLFLRMRLGKTLVAIRWIADKNPKKVLIVAPLTVLTTWKEELKLEGFRSHVISGKDYASQLDDGIIFYLINYERLRSNPTLLDLKWCGIILDESTKIKNPKPQISELIVEETSHIPYRAALTGLPNPESYMDFFNQMKFLFDEFIGHTNWWAFRDEHFIESGYDWFIKRESQSEIIGTIHNTCRVVTRKDVGIGSEPVYEKRMIRLPSDVRKAYRKVEDEWELGGTQTQFRIVVDTWLAKLAGGSMPGYENRYLVKELVSLLRGELRNEQVLVGFRYNTELDMVRKAFNQLPQNTRVGYEFITGAVKSRERHRRLRLFQRGKRQVMLMQQKCGMYGVDCSCADTLVFYSRYYNGEINNQFSERIIHPTSKNDKLIIDLVPENTIAEDILKAIRSKEWQQKMITNRMFKQMVLKNFEKRMMS